MSSNPRARLDARLVEKIAHARRKPEKYVREQISKSAARLGIASEAAQIVMARELGLGTAQALRNLLPHLQDQVHRAPNATDVPRSLAQKPGASRRKAMKTVPEIAAI